MDGGRREGAPSDQGGLAARLHRIVFETDTQEGRTFELVIIALILFSVAAIIVSSYPDVHREHAAFFYDSETLVVAIFSVEYLLRLWLCDIHHVGGSTLRDRAGRKLRFILQPMSVIDLVAIAPFYVHGYLAVLGSTDFRIVRVLRVFRLFRLFKLGRYSHALESLGGVLLRGRRVFTVLGLVYVISLLVFSSFLYSVESHVGTFESIPQAFGWSLQEVTDIGTWTQPRTEAGLVLAELTVLIHRIALECIFVGVFGAIFIEQFVRERAQRCPDPACGFDRIDSSADYCPVCGKRLAERAGCCDDNPSWASFCRFCGKRLKARAGAQA